MMSDYAPGMPFFLPHGMILRNILENYWYEEHTKEGYQFIKTPIMMSKELWEVPDTGITIRKYVHQHG